MLESPELQIEPAGGGRYRFGIGDRWCFHDRAFGGYTAAMALAAMFADQREAGHPHDVAASLSVSFLAPGAVGPAEVAVDVRRAGRSAVALGATVVQGDRTLLTASAWLADSWGEAPTAPIDHAGTGQLLAHDARSLDPDDAASLAWLPEAWPPLTFGERRAVDYASSWAEFRRGRPTVALWMRTAEDLGSIHPQLGDVLHADAHLFDSPGQMTGFTEADLLSLDLVVSWQPGAARYPASSWRLFEGRGSVAAGAVTAMGTFQAVDGAHLAICTSQGLLR